MLFEMAMEMAQTREEYGAINIANNMARLIASSFLRPILVPKRAPNLH
jgi:hypothetical protein